jgi:hypothetical protein
VAVVGDLFVRADMFAEGVAVELSVRWMSWATYWGLQLGLQEV